MTQLLHSHSLQILSLIKKKKLYSHLQGILSKELWIFHDKTSKDKAQIS